MKKVTKSILAILLGILMLITAMPLSASAANYSPNWKQYPTPTVTLKRGAKGNNVKWLQCAINDLIINGDKNGKKLNTTKLDVDGSFGPGVEKAVKKFQSSYSLTADGSFGPASRSKMVSVLKGSGGCTHNWVLKDVSSKATCTQNGLKHERCTECGDDRAVTLPATGHTEKTEYKDGFKFKTCTVCGTETYNEQKIIVKKLMNDYCWTSYECWCVIDKMEDYNRKQFTSDVRTKAKQLGKTYSIASKFLSSKELGTLSKTCKNVCTVCDYIDLAFDLKAMCSSTTTNYDRMSATVSALRTLTSKVPCGTAYTSALDTISKGLDNTLKLVRKERLTKIWYDWATSDIYIDGFNRPIQNMSVRELNKNRSKVSTALIKHYKAVYGKTYEAALKNMSNEQYVNMFFEMKNRQEICGKANFEGFVEQELKVLR